MYDGINEKFKSVKPKHQLLCLGFHCSNFPLSIAVCRDMFIEKENKNNKSCWDFISEGF